MSRDPLVFAFFFDGGWLDLIWHASNLIITVALFIGFIRERRKRIELKAAADVLAVLAKLEGVYDARANSCSHPDR